MISLAIAAAFSVVVPNTANAACLLNGTTSTNSGTGGSDVILCDPTNDPSGANVTGLAGNDTITINGGTANTVNAGLDNDTVNMSGGAVTVDVILERGADDFTLTAGTVGRNVYLGQTNFTSTDADVFIMNGGAIGGSVFGDTGVDTITVEAGASIAFDISTSSGSDIVTLNDAVIGRHVNLGGGDDTFDITGTGGVNGIVTMGTGTDIFTMDGTSINELRLGFRNNSSWATTDDAGTTNTATINTGTINTHIYGTGGIDIITVETGASVGGTITTGNDADVVTVNGTSVGGSIATGNGVDTVVLNDATVGGNVDLGGDNDTFTIDGMDVVSGDVVMGTGADVFTMNGGTINDLRLATAGSSVDTAPDVATINAGTITGSIVGSTGVDTITVEAGASVAFDISTSSGSDIVTLNDATIGRHVNLGGDDDTFTVDGLDVVTGEVVMGTGNDTYTQDGGTIGRLLLGFRDNSSWASDDAGTTNTATITSGTINSHIYGTGGIDIITVETGATVGGSIVTGNDTDTLTVNSTIIGGSVNLGGGDDTFDITGTGGVNGIVTMGTGTDIFTMDGTSINELRLGFRNNSSWATTDDAGTTNTATINTGTINTHIYGTGGIDIITVETGASVGGTITTGNDADVVTVNGTSVGGSIATGNGNDVITWVGGTIGGQINGGDGSDTATVAAAEYDGSQVLDGGDDVGLGDGFNDALTLDGISVTVNAGGIANWESVTVLDGTIDFGTSIEVGSGPDLGLIVGSGGLVSSIGDFSLTGDLETQVDGGYQNVSGNAAMIDIVGSLRNAGTFDVQDGFVGDTITVSQDYTGAGSLLIDVDAVGDMADTLVISGSVVTGGTTLFIQDISTGDASGNDILIVDVTGTSVAGDFLLSEDRIDLGGTQYALNLVGTQWFLQEVALSENLFYEAYPQHIRGLNELRSHRQRLLGRNWLTEGDHVCQQDARDALGDLSRCRGEGIWVAARGTVADLSPHRSTTQAELETSDMNYDAHRTHIEIGYEAPPRDYDGGNFVSSAMIFYGAGTLAGESSEGNVAISSESLGLGAGLTWYDDTGVYVDAQLQIARAESEFTVAGVAQRSTNDANSYAASLEIGKVVPLNEDYTITPELQYMVYAVDFDDLVTEGGDEVGITDGITSELRIGGTLEYSWNPQTADKGDLYVTANLFRGIDMATAINAADEALSTELYPWRGELGLGVVREWSNDHGARSAFFAEVSVGSHLGSGWGSGQRASGSVGIEFGF
ncbi:autotransporter outer membrane beta-barrel domain-containing protein [Loktanella sp. Alg231-35]|uniref:autotransporter outer membrane beta-barrel domain-containing protein n=1 Tax=Loktanella sp. Alg231-35 TaxID=1922220 RepID=UPI00131EE55C|nr:autotransporter outer membrane beta-barrel domain-containing protein [Loktanella sp. Alg231-35]